MTHGSDEKQAELPASRTNRPGLDEIDFRLGTHGSFLQRMLERIHRQEHPGKVLGEEIPDDQTHPLRALRTRESVDPSIAMLDAWAVVADVLTFYQERIANELYVRTAEQRRSLVELAEMIGYRPGPGVAASTHLAFTIDDSDQTPNEVTVPKGTPVQSVPAKEELPQTFETGQPVEAQVAQNALHPPTEEPQYLALLDGGGSEPEIVVVEAPVRGDSGGGVAKGKLYLVGPEFPRPEGAERFHVRHLDEKSEGANRIHLAGNQSTVNAGAPLLLIGTGGWRGDSSAVKKKVVKIDAVEVAENGRRTDLRISIPETDGDDDEGDPVRLVERGMYSYAWSSESLVLESIKRGFRGTEWAGILERGATADGGDASEEEDSPDAADKGIYVFRENLGFFGHDAPTHASLNSAYKDPASQSPYKNQNWDKNEFEIWEKFVAGEPGAGASKEDYASSSERGDKPSAYLSRKVESVAPNSWMVVRGRQTKGASGSSEDPLEELYEVKDVEVGSVTGFSLSAEATGLVLKKGHADPAFGVRSSTAYVASEQVDLAEMRLPRQIRNEEASEGEPPGARKLRLEGLRPGLVEGKEVIVEGERIDENGRVGAEVVTVAGSRLYQPFYTVIELEEPLEHVYARESVTVYGNVVGATHGETVTEVLGSGDASQKSQSFELSKPPLTYLSTDEPGGVKSTLTIRVDGVEWDQVESFYGTEPTDEVYIVERDEDGTTRVVFGDGVHGARLSTGRENVFARYRSGIGLSGEVDDGQITLLKKKPKGVRSVTNPVRAIGGANPESRDSMRANAPRTTKVLGRAVSLTDYADFALLRPEVTRATASLIPAAAATGTPDILVTVVGTGSDPADATLSEERREQLRRAVEGASDGRHRVHVCNYAAEQFGLEASIEIDSRFRFEDVRESVEDRLERRWGFVNQDFGTVLTESDVLSAIQEVEAVEAVYLDKLGMLELTGGDLEFASGSEGDVRRIVARDGRREAEDVEDEGSGRSCEYAPAELAWLALGMATIRQKE